MQPKNTIEINGEYVTVREAQGLIRMLYNDAKQIAGEFHNMERSEKFRLNWPDEDQFAESEWRNFVQAARALYTQRLADPATAEHDKQRIFKALVLERKIAEGKETDNRLQIMPDSQQFWGDKYENRKILEHFGKAPNLRAYLRRSTMSMTKH